MVPGDETVRLAIVGADDRDESTARERSGGEGAAASADLAALESKLESAEGVSGLASWLREVEEVVSAIEGPELEKTREEIREVIDKLLQINAEVQNLLRLKKLLA